VDTIVSTVPRKLEKRNATLATVEVVLAEEDAAVEDTTTVVEDVEILTDK